MPNLAEIGGGGLVGYRTPKLENLVKIAVFGDFFRLPPLPAFPSLTFPFSPSFPISFHSLYSPTLLFHLHLSSRPLLLLFPTVFPSLLLGRLFDRVHI